MTTETQGAGSIILTLYNTLIQVSASVTGSMDASIFSAMQNIFFNSIAYSLIGLILVFYLFFHLKAGFSRDDLFKGGTWLIVLACVYGIMSSFSAYSEFKSWFLIPQSIMKVAIGSATGTSDAGQMLNNTFAKVYDVFWAALDYGAQKEADENNLIFDDPGFSNYFMAFIKIIFWWVSILAYAFVVLVIFIMQIASNFALSIFGCFAPMLVFLLLMPQTRGYFFSWLKNYIAISFYIPMTMLPLLLIDKSLSYVNLDPKGITLWTDTMKTTLMSLVIVVLALYILMKIPEWINIILGTQESGGGFTAGAAQGMIAGSAKAATTGASMGISAPIKGFKMASSATRFTAGVVDGFRGKGKLGASNARQKGTNIASAVKNFTGKTANGFSAISNFYKGRG